METADLIRTTFAHHRWATRTLLGKLEFCDAQELVDAKYPGAQSPLETFHHMAGAEAFWSAHLHGADVMAALDAFRKLSTVSEVGATWEDIYESAFDAYLVRLDDQELERRLSVTFPRGDPFSPAVHEALTQLAGHSAQHRSELALMVSGLGHSPGDFDLLSFLPETAEDAEAK